MLRLPGRLIAFFTISVAILGAIGLEWLVGRVSAVRIAGAVLAVAAIGVAVDMTAYARRFVEPRAVAGLFPQRFPGRVTPGGRVLSVCEGSMHALDLVALGIPTVDGYNPYFLSGMARYASRALHEQPRRFYMSYPRIGEHPILPDLSLLDVMNVTELLSCVPLRDRRLTLESAEDGYLVYRNGGAVGRVAPLGDTDIGCPLTPPNRAHGFAVGSYRGDRFDGRMRVNVVMPRTQGLLLAEPYYPGRRAFVDRREVPISRVYETASAICVPAGSHAIELRYGTGSIVTGAAITLVTGVGWFAAATVSRRRRRG
jgi:hypothetical protein